MSDNIISATPTAGDHPSVLLGHPVALAETMLKLELQGGPVSSQAWAALDAPDPLAADHAYRHVEFPVLLGQAEKFGDGLLGYFKHTPEGGYEYGHFYTQRAASTTDRVQQPQPNTVSLTAGGDTTGQRLLLLLDPRVPVHATTGILPTKALALPADHYAAALRQMEACFLVAPVLQGRNGLRLPTPAAPGGQWAWLEPRPGTAPPEWLVTEHLPIATEQGLAAYTPQSLREGWLRYTTSAQPTNP